MPNDWRVANVPPFKKAQGKVRELQTGDPNIVMGKLLEEILRDMSYIHLER